MAPWSSAWGQTFELAGDWALVDASEPEDPEASSSAINVSKSSAASAVFAFLGVLWDAPASAMMMQGTRRSSDASESYGVRHLSAQNVLPTRLSPNKER